LDLYSADKRLERYYLFIFENGGEHTPELSASKEKRVTREFKFSNVRFSNAIRFVDRRFGIGVDC
jgi:hypothetical protein